MAECGLSLGGVGGAALASAYCDEALDERRALSLLLATREETVVGFVLTLSGPWSYWRGFLFRHPQIAWRLLWSSLVARRSAAEGPPGQWYAEYPPSRRVLMVGVAPGLRRQGLAKLLYQHLFESTQTELRALIATDNHASLALHRATGWTLLPQEDCVLAIRPG